LRLIIFVEGAALLAIKARFVCRKHFRRITVVHGSSIGWRSLSARLSDYVVGVRGKARCSCAGPPPAQGTTWRKFASDEALWWRADALLEVAGTAE